MPEILADQNEKTKKRNTIVKIIPIIKGLSFQTRLGKIASVITADKYKIVAFSSRERSDILL